LHSTLISPDAPPLLSTTYANLSADIQKLKNLLSPASVTRDFPRTVLDTGKPLASGLRSFAKILNGTVTYTALEPDFPGAASLVGLVNRVEEGSIERNDERIIAYLKLGTGFKQIDDFNRSLGLEIFEIYSEADEISCDPNKPTIFEAPLDWVCPPGSKVFHPMLGQEVDFSGFAISTFTHASGFLDGERFKGVVEVRIRVSAIPFPMRIISDFEVVIG
jgi:hypothetical protein